MSMEEIERQRIPLAERMVREPFWLGLITVLVVMIVIGVGYLVKKHLPEKIEKILRSNQEAAVGPCSLDQNLSGKVNLHQEWEFYILKSAVLEVVQRSHPRSSSLLTLVYVIYSQWSNIIQL